MNLYTVHILGLDRVVEQHGMGSGEAKRAVISKLPENERHRVVLLECLETRDVLCVECKHFDTDAPPCSSCLSQNKQHWEPQP